jgi:hypothetical protein
VNQFIYVWYHYMFGTIAQPAATDATWGSHGVWDTYYDAVWHMEGASSANEADSKGMYTLTDTGAVGSTTGQIGNSRNSFSASKYLSYGTTGAGIPETGAYSISFWANVTNLALNGDIIDNANGTYIQYGVYLQSHSGTAVDAVVRQQNAAGSAYITTSGHPINATGWWHVVLTYNGSGTGLWYINGASKAVTGTGITLPTTAHCGATIVGTGSNWGVFPYPADELRVAHSVRAVSWILAEYNNQNSPSTFSTASGAGTYTLWWQSLGFLGQ